MTRLYVAFAALAGAAVASTAAADVVTEWNANLLESVASTPTPPPRAARAMAMTHAAVYDAVNSITGTHQPYLASFPAAPGASKEAAAAYAAHRVLKQLFPTRAAALDEQLALSLSTIGSGPAVDAGRECGLACANAILTARASDGASVAPPPYLGGLAPGQWRPTPPTEAAGVLPAWGQVTPFGLTSGSQFRPPPPPALGSAEYRDAYNQVKSLGGAFSNTRTEDQTEAAFMWVAGAGSVTPPGLWNQVAQSLAAAQSVEENARMFALLNFATADAGISCWDAKYEYSFWRPITGINLGDTDGNDETLADPDWVPLISTPAFPAYTSGHSTFSAAAASILAQWFGSDEFEFSITSDGITRFYTSFSDAAHEASMSRIYGGIHWIFDGDWGNTQGYQIGEWIFDHYLQVPAPSALALLGAGAALVARRRR
jgi:hypothetical protein